MGYIKTLNEAKELLANREPFNAGTLTADYEYSGGADYRYTVKSYGVAIGSCYEDGTGILIQPNAYTHSKTTSKHANIVKRAWNLI